MPINSIATATKFTGELDKVFAQKSVTGFMLDNAFAAKFVGAHTVSIPDIDLVGLANYNKDEGFSRAGATITRRTYTLAMDRGRSIQIDREDMDEAGIAGLAGQVLGEFVRTKVVPECDAYVLSKLFNIAATNSHATAYDGDGTPTTLEQILGEINKVQAGRGFDEELVAFVDPLVYAALMKDTATKGIVDIANFKQGGIDLKVKTLNGCAIIPVPAARMRTKYTFSTGMKTDDTTITTTVTPSSGTAEAVSSFVANDPTAGGFTPDESGVTVGAATAKFVKAIIMPKKACSLVKKSEKMRIWTPEQNFNADAFKFDYRLYYDALVKHSMANDVYALFATE